MKLFCPTCKRYDDYHVHCKGCDEPLYSGEEVVKVAEDDIYCLDCCWHTELEVPERDGDFERKARLERAMENDN